MACLAPHMESLTCPVNVWLLAAAIPTSPNPQSTSTAIAVVTFCATDFTEHPPRGYALLQQWIPNSTIGYSLSFGNEVERHRHRLVLTIDVFLRHYRIRTRQSYFVIHVVEKSSQVAGVVDIAFFHLPLSCKSTLGTGVNAIDQQFTHVEYIAFRHFDVVCDGCGGVIHGRMPQNIGHHVAFRPVELLYRPQVVS